VETLFPGRERLWICSTWSCGDEKKKKKKKKKKKRRRRRRRRGSRWVSPGRVGCPLS
jgi:hypothetical protein